MYSNCAVGEASPVMEGKEAQDDDREGTNAAEPRTDVRLMTVVSSRARVFVMIGYLVGFWREY